MTSELDQLVERSRRIGANPSLVVWGGGNTSSKIVERDHLGRERLVLRIKGSGTDLKTIDRSGFPGVYVDEVLPLRAREDMSDEEMVAYLEHCLVDPKGIRPSIETLLHAFLPARHVDHTHADAIVTLTNTKNGRDVVREALGEGVGFVPWRRPGFQLAKQVAELSDYEAVVLENHGLITWGETHDESFGKTRDIVERAKKWLTSKAPSRESPRILHGHGAMKFADVRDLPLRIRSRLGHRILHTDHSPEARSIVDRLDVAEIGNAGPATADHVLRIRPWACVIKNLDPGSAIDAYIDKYRQFFERHAPPDLQMLDPLPRVFLVPGIGIITAGRDQKDALVTSEVAMHTLSIAARGKDVHGNYRSLDEKDLFDVEYWSLELYKLTLAPPSKQLEGRCVVVTGAASGIGRAIAVRLARDGAQVALFDIDLSGLGETERRIGEAGGCAQCIGVDLTDEGEVARAFQEVILAAGGVDGLVSNAGIASAGPLTEIDSELWRRSLEVNTTSHFLVTQIAMKVMVTQGLGGSLVFVASKNALGPGAGFGAYSVGKAGEVQLARIAALEGGPSGIRANVVNPDAVFEDSKLWTDEVKRERAAAHGVAVEDLEDFYAQRNLLKTIVTPSDVAEAVAFLISDRSKATTGTVLTVDGGVAAAFPR